LYHAAMLDHLAKPHKETFNFYKTLREINHGKANMIELPPNRTQLWPSVLAAPNLWILIPGCHFIGWLVS
jgi:hypothetical protein